MGSMMGVNYVRGRRGRKRKGPRQLVITQPRRDLLRYIVRYRQEHGYGPTVREMAAELDMYLEGARHHLDKLMSVGKVLVDRLPSGQIMPRSWRVP